MFLFRILRLLSLFMGLNIYDDTGLYRRGLNLSSSWSSVDVEEAVSCGTAHPLEWSSSSPSCPSRVRAVAEGHTESTHSWLSRNQSLLPVAFEGLPLGSVRPLGWLKDQLQLMADGFPGHGYDFYRFVRASPWLGGTSEYSPLNEAFPYWLNGLVPLAYGLDDDRLKAQVREAAEHVISHQELDGWLGPETDLNKRNFWPHYPLFLGLAQLVEAEPSTPLATDAIQAMHRFVDLMHSMLLQDYQGYVHRPGDDFDEQWGRSRAADMVLALQWLYEKNPTGNSVKIWECMKSLYEQAYDWSFWFSQDCIKSDIDALPADLAESLFPYIHVVNAAQALKTSAVFRRLTRSDRLLDSSRHGVNLTFTYHGTPSGSIIGDERLSGLSPTRGTELCAVVETMFSLSYLYQAVGDNEFADRGERAAFNALPVMTTADWWAHQYVAQTNQPISHELSRSPFWNVGELGQTYGLEPNYPCCAVNHPQGYPKFLSASYVRRGERGLAHALLGPAEVTTATQSGAKVYIRCDTAYPFNHLLRYTVNSDQGFVFSIRVPAWAIGSRTTVSLNGGSPITVSPDLQTGMHDIDITAGTTDIVYELAAEVRIEPRANDTIAVYYGALNYAVSVAGNYSSQPPQNYPDGSGAPDAARDWAITPISSWAVAIDPSTLQFFSTSSTAEELPDPIFTDDAPPTAISALACEINWTLADGYASTPPKAAQRHCRGKPFKIMLKPYGAAKLHVAELPTVDLAADGDESLSATST